MSAVVRSGSESEHSDRPIASNGGLPMAITCEPSEPVPGTKRTGAGRRAPDPGRAGERGLRLGRRDAEPRLLRGGAAAGGTAVARAATPAAAVAAAWSSLLLSPAHVADATARATAGGTRRAPAGSARPPVARVTRPRAGGRPALGGRRPPSGDPDARARLRPAEGCGTDSPSHRLQRRPSRPRGRGSSGLAGGCGQRRTPQPRAARSDVDVRGWGQRQKRARCAAP